MFQTNSHPQRPALLEPLAPPGALSRPLPVLPVLLGPLVQPGSAWLTLPAPAEVRCSGLQQPASLLPYVSWAQRS